jgi:tRNA pseudouridine38-40 synthase
VWWVRERLDEGRMQEAAAALTGFGDFRAFTDDDPEEKSTRVLIDEVTVGGEGDLILVRVVGSHFLWKMVRRIVGVLVDAGQGGLTPAEVTALLSSASDLPPKLTAPASGLFLERVFYDASETRPPLNAAAFRVSSL